MGLCSFIAKATTVGIATATAFTALPVFGAAGIITTGGIIASAAIGVVTAAADDESKEKD